jgi:hypothetical protein
MSCIPSLPGRWSNPAKSSVLCSLRHTLLIFKLEVALTSIDVFPDSLGDRASLGLLNALRLQTAAVRSEAAVGVHGPLQRVALPSEDVVSVLAIARGIPSAEHEGLAVGRPQRTVVELGGIPDNLQHELRDLDGVARRAVASRQEVGGPVHGVGDLRAMLVWGSPRPTR